GWLPRTPAVLHTYFWVFVVQSVSLLVGAASRANALCVFVWLVSFQNRNVLLLDGEDSVFRLIGFFLIFMPLGQAWSIDALVRPEITRRPASGWALRLLQVQMAIIYFAAAILKLQGDTWIDGTALYYVARLDDYFGRFPMPDLLFDVPILVKLLTWSVIAVEFFVPLLVWFRETRVACLVVAALFHLACEYSMNLFLFHWIMLVGWMAFLDGAYVHKFRSSIR
ncbi:MAG: HTTM domain-containing protein, partial [Planctomycetes bacterium]|nr:HTTM domain-containing protein [Planctomycetota bacterium]